MAAAIRENPQSYTLLHAQCELLRTKGKSDWALQLAKQAVNAAPSEFATWSKLTELYTDLGKFDSVRRILLIIIVTPPNFIVYMLRLS